MGNDAAAAAAGEADRAFQRFQDEGGISNPLFRGPPGKQGAAGHVTHATNAVHDSRAATICSSAGRPYIAGMYPAGASRRTLGSEITRCVQDIDRTSTEHQS